VNVAYDFFWKFDLIKICKLYISFFTLILSVPLLKHAKRQSKLTKAMRIYVMESK